MNDEKILVERTAPYNHTPDGSELACLLEEAITPIFMEFMRRGYSPMQICAVAYNAVAKETREAGYEFPRSKKE